MLVFSHGLLMQRLLVPAACCLLISVASAGLMALADRQDGAAPPVSPGAAAGGTTPATGTASGAAPASTAATGSSATNSAAAKRAADEAAARHAKRTACLKNARLKKLVGEQRTSYVKDCLGATAAPVASSSAAPAQ
jgi:hypothetical protein